MFTDYNFSHKCRFCGNDASLELAVENHVKKLFTHVCEECARLLDSSTIYHCATCDSLSIVKGGYGGVRVINGCLGCITFQGEEKKIRINVHNELTAN